MDTFGKGSKQNMKLRSRNGWPPLASVLKRFGVGLFTKPLKLSVTIINCIVKDKKSYFTILYKHTFFHNGISIQSGKQGKEMDVVSW